MKKQKNCRIAALLAVLLAFLSTMNANAENPNDGKMKNAVSIADSLAAGKFAQCVSLFDTTMQAALPSAALEQVWKQLIARYGAYKQRLAPTVQHVAGATILLVPVVFARGTLDLKIAFAGSDKVAGFFVVPHVESSKGPAYANATAYTDVAVVVGEGKWKLNGTISVPRGNGPFPALILVHGSGPNDRDESLGPNKPFRDLAHGLASRGIVVLRYDKRTFQYAKEFLGNAPKSFTIKDESLDDVLAAATVLRARPDVNRKAIFVLGHSLSGMILPRIAAQDTDLRGLISLAGSNVPLEDAIIKQSQYISSLGGASADSVQQLAVVARQIKALQEADRDKNVTLLGAGPAYWLDLRAHDPLVEVKSVNRPMLFLQGGRDYQVTAEDDFANWQKALKDRGALVEFKLYPELNHLFIAGKGKATPQEYATNAGHVDVRVVDDIAAWIKQQSRDAG